LRKFLWETVIQSNFNQVGIYDFPYYRLGEMYLNYAEALNEAAGPTSEVYTAIKKIRTRAGMPELPAGLSKDQMRERIRNERAVELSFEEHRFWDARRWKTGESALGGPIYGVEVTGTSPAFQYKQILVETRVFNPKSMYLFPIPQAEIDKNLGLTQNPGW